MHSAMRVDLAECGLRIQTLRSDDIASGLNQRRGNCHPVAARREKQRAGKGNHMILLLSSPFRPRRQIAPASKSGTISAKFLSQLGKISLSARASRDRSLSGVRITRRDLLVAGGAATGLFLLTGGMQVLRSEPSLFKVTMTTLFWVGGQSKEENAFIPYNGLSYVKHSQHEYVV